MIEFKNSFFPAILARGRDLDSDNIKNIRKIGDTYECDSVGSNDNTYFTFVRVKDNQFIDGSCTCPYNGNCKHMAGLLYKINSSKDIKEANSIDDFIDSLDIDTLRGIVKSLSQRNSDCYKELVRLKNISLSFKERIDKALMPGEENYDAIVDILKDMEVTLNSKPEEIIKLINYILDILMLPKNGDSYSFDAQMSIEDVILKLLSLYRSSNNLSYLDAFIERVPFIDQSIIEDFYYLVEEMIDSRAAKRILELFKAKLYYMPDFILERCLRLSDTPSSEVAKIKAERDSIPALLEEYLISLDRDNKNKEFDYNLIRADAEELLIEPAYNVAYKHYLRLGRKRKALNALRRLYLATEDIKYFNLSLELSTIKAELRYYNDSSIIYSLLSYLNMYDKLMLKVKESKNIYYYLKYAGILSPLYKEDYMEYASKELRKKALRWDSESLDEINSLINIMLNIDKESPYLYKLAKFIYNEAYLTKERLEYFALLKPYNK